MTGVTRLEHVSDLVQCLQNLDDVHRLRSSGAAQHALTGQHSNRTTPDSGDGMEGEGGREGRRQRDPSSTTRLAVTPLLVRPELQSALLRWPAHLLGLVNHSQPRGGARKVLNRKQERIRIGRVSARKGGDCIGVTNCGADTPAHLWHAAGRVHAQSGWRLAAAGQLPKRASQPPVQQTPHL